MTGLLVVGAGGHGNVVADTASEQGDWQQIAFLDDRYPELTQQDRWPVLGRLQDAENWKEQFSELVVAIGDNALRAKLIGLYHRLGFKLPVVIHPSASVSRYAKVGAGSVVFAQTAVNFGTCLGDGSIINTGATVDHDCILGKCVHVSTGAHIAGGVQIGELSWIGIGASVRELMIIGSRVIVGAGSVVVKNVENGVTVFGVPARVHGENP